MASNLNSAADDGQRTESTGGLFVSYSHEDREWFLMFKEILDAVPNFDAWTDSSIRKGDDWDDTIQTALDDSRTALLLVSPKFFTSRYIQSKELPAILQAKNDRNLTILWVRVRPVPDQVIPPELHDIQSFTFEDSSKSALAELSPGDAASAINAICEDIIGRAKFTGESHYNIYESIKDTVWRFGYRSLKEIGHGDFSIVYRAERPGSSAAIKALFTSPLSDWDFDYEPYLEEAATLKNPTFVKLLRWDLDTEPRFLVTEWLDCCTLKEHLKDLKVEGKLMNVDTVRFIIKQLADALAEYHDREVKGEKLRYTNIKPADVLLQQTDAGFLPRLAAYRFGQMAVQEDHRRHHFLVDAERLTYMTPGQVRNEDVTPLTDQYSLGLLAVEMLQGEAPVIVEHLAHIDNKKAFFENPQEFTSVMQRRAPRLAETVLRMLSKDPGDRWPSLSELSKKLGDGHCVRELNRWLAKCSYNEFISGNTDFFETFYRNLRAGKHNKRINDLFTQKVKSWDTQYRVLDESICSLLNFSEDQARTPPTLLSSTARKHAEMDLKKKDYTHFLNSFLKTLRSIGLGDEEIQSAWRSTLGDGIRYMQKYGVKRKSR